MFNPEPPEQRSQHAGAVHASEAQARRPGGGNAVLFCDVDRFKSINDRYGHAAGDWLLKATADRLRGAVHDSDFVARIGGDEFIVLLCPADRERAIDVAERIIAACARPLDVGTAAQVPAGASIGIALAPSDRGVDTETLLREADVALYEAKRDGRGCWRLASEAAPATPLREGPASHPARAASSPDRLAAAGTAPAGAPTGHGDIMVAP